ncbi:M43 family zinc metalloprotease [Flavobacterium saccharophilum]|uniref:Por secretion system C-terminal sorting domain-containing protein n=1 Tax=Flavobacterium saccharophilum TaxID=29534 RepID=A0A1M7JZH0_9FLAO|nr:M43 family zinc metalloprotease [Flavobacterium saccharophilum]SHM58354.1 Por secretion system C-terminal sorting domain-containing protein [Flavobacterium saccharophilum]
MKIKLLILLFFTIVKMSAQGLPCRTTEENAKVYRSNPNSLKEKKEFDAFTKKFALQRKSKTSKEAGVTYTIPVVFHIYGDVQSGKTVTYEKIVNHLAQLNDDFNGLNADYQTVESFFQARRGTLKVEFKLAKKDPNGGCTTGVVFHPAKNGYGNGGGYDDQIAADAWDNTKYMNVYIQNDLYNEGVFNNSGVAWYPNSDMTANNTARVVFNGAYLYDNSYSKEFSATLTHEFGHFMNLIHTFEGGCSGTDEVDDTPAEDGLHTLACTPGTNCTGDKVNFENYMGYNGAQGCYKMYTQGQIDRMLAALQHPARITLWQPQNLIDTGVNAIESSLVANATTFKETVINDGAFDSASVITIGGSKTFALSSGTMTAGTHFTHTFPAGITPVVTVNTNGQVTVTLSGKATNHAAAQNTTAGITFLPAAFTGGTTGLSCTAIFFNLKFTDPYGIFFVDMPNVSISSALTWKAFEIAKGDDTSFGGWRYVANALKIETYGKKLVCESGTRNISLLGQNVAVGPASNMTAPGAYPNQLDLRAASYTAWEGKSGYVGFEYQIDGQTCYGWFKVDVAANGDAFTISEYAYNTQPNTPIYTGMTAKTAVVLSDSTLYETDANDGGFATTSTISLSTNNGTFTKTSGTLTPGTDFTVTGTPSGLTTVLTLQGNNKVVVSFTGKATANTPTNDAAVVITFKDAAITGGIATLDSVSKTINLKFEAPYGVVYVNNPDYVASAAQTWQYFDLAIGDNTEYGVWQYAAAALKMETYGKRLVGQAGTRNITLINEGTAIGASSNFVTPGAYPDQLDLRTATYIAWDNKTGYVGFEYTSRGRTCYGWMHVKVEAGGVGYTVLDFAYNTKPNELILAGTQTGTTVLAPTSLTATANNTNLEVQLTWVNNAANATNIVIERAGTDNIFTEIVTLPGTALTYTNTGLTAGNTYKYKVRAKANTIYSAYSNEVSATITSNSSYCTTQSDNKYEYINSVTIGSFTNASGKDTAGYADYTSKVVTLNPSSVTNVSLTPGFSGDAYLEYWGIWIDYNKNNVFDPSEKVIDGISSNGTATGSFTALAFTGSTRMRIVMKYYSNPSACGNITDGEVEDYTVVSGTVRPPNPVTLATPANIGNSGVYATGFYASWNTVSNATSYEVQLNNAATGWTTFGTSTIYYLWIPKQGTQTVYQFRVRAKNATEISDWSAPLTIDLQNGSAGADQKDFTKSFSMYPNPASDIVNFNFSNLNTSVIKITIYDSTGVVVDVVENVTSYPVHRLRKGFYIVVATDGSFTASKKLLVK